MVRWSSRECGRRATPRGAGRIDHIYKDPHNKDARMYLHYGDMTDTSCLIAVLRKIWCARCPAQPSCPGPCVSATRKLPRPPRRRRLRALSAGTMPCSHRVRRGGVAGGQAARDLQPCRAEPRGGACQSPPPLASPGLLLKTYIRLFWCHCQHHGPTASTLPVPTLDCELNQGARTLVQG